MKLVSVNVGRVRDADGTGEGGQSAIWKAPVAGRVHLRTLKLEGDEQANLKVHGGPYRAAYLYPAEHYDFWRVELPEVEFSYGMFGENLTVTGLREDDVRIGDRLSIGDAEVVVTSPRMPCRNLNMRFGRSDMVKRFTQSRRVGFYLGVEREGEVGAGDEVAFTHRASESLSIAEIVTLYLSPEADPALLRRASGLEKLEPGWREHFAKQLGGS